MIEVILIWLFKILAPKRPRQASRFSSLKLTISLSSFSVFFKSYLKLLGFLLSSSQWQRRRWRRRRQRQPKRYAFSWKKIIFFITHWVFCLFFWFCTVLCWFFVWLNMKWIENLIGFWVFEDERLKNRRSRLTRETIG